MKQRSKNEAMKGPDTQPDVEAAKYIVYNSIEEVFAHKREQTNKALSKVDPEELKALLNRVKQ